MISIVKNIRKYTSCTALEYVAGEITIWIKSHSFRDGEYQSDSKATTYMEKFIGFCNKHSIENISFQWTQEEIDNGSK